MKNEQLAAQLRLASSILETGHPWEFRRAGDDEVEWRRAATGSIGEILDMFTDGYEIRLALATPGDGRVCHNPYKLTAEQVGAGWRLLIPEEIDEKSHSDCERWSELNNQFMEDDGDGWGWYPDTTIRVSLSTPWPEAKVEPIMVPLEAKDAPPGSVFRFKAKADWVTPLCVGDNAVGFPDPNDGRVLKMSFSDLMETAEINKSIPITGKWDADAWEACQKDA